MIHIDIYINQQQKKKARYLFRGDYGEHEGEERVVHRHVIGIQKLLHAIDR